MQRCSRCGRETHCEYGSDGQAYCGSCIFYGLNKPCFKCRMYLPASELQQYNGQWLCPYCLMDSRDEERRMEQGADRHYKSTAMHEKCERCGRTLSIVYYHAGRRLCETCFEDAKNQWGDAGGEKPPVSMIRVGRETGQRLSLVAFLEGVFSEVLVRLGLKKKQEKQAQGEIVAMRQKARSFVPLAKPMKEEAMGKKEPEEKPAKEKKKSKRQRQKEKEAKKERFGSFKEE